MLQKQGEVRAAMPGGRRRAREGVRIDNTFGGTASIGDALARIFPGSCCARFTSVFLAFTLTPMTALVVWMAVNNGAPREMLLAALAAGLFATLCGVLVAYWLVHEMMRPLRRAVTALEGYEHGQTLPEWPVVQRPDDDMGRLLTGLQRCLQTVDAAQRKLEQHALEDSLTHAMNRRGAVQALRSSVSASHATGDPFVLVVVDLDNLKAINDAHGHAAGDFALASLVSSARECCLGKSDWIGRWGGDEFLLGLHADPQIACDRVRLWVDVLARPEAELLPVHVSAGAAILAPDMDAGQLYRRADAVMYKAKFAGGQRLLAAEEDPDSAVAACA